MPPQLQRLIVPASWDADCVSTLRQLWAGAGVQVTIYS